MRTLTMALLAAAVAVSGVKAQSSSIMDRIEEILSSGTVRSVEDLLRVLSRDREFTDYALMYRSRGLQNASFRSPRAIVSFPEEGFVLAFNGDGDQIEIMEFDDVNRAFNFYEVSLTGGLPTITDPNPRKCRECHGLYDPRPLWDSYDLWPGMYGGDANFITSDVHSIIAGIESAGLDILDPDTPVREFMEGLTREPIYESREGRELWRFTLSRDQHPRYTHLEALPRSPGTTLGKTLIRWNRQRIERKIEEAINEAPYFRYALLGTSFCTPREQTFLSLPPLPSLSLYIPDHILDRAEESPEEYFDRYRAMSHREIKRRVSIHLSSGGKASTDRSPHFTLAFPNLAPLKYVMELAGLDIVAEDLSLHRSGMPIMFNGAEPTARLIQPISSESFVRSQLRSEEVEGDLCEFLARKSIDTLTSSTF